MPKDQRKHPPRARKKKKESPNPFLHIGQGRLPTLRKKKVGGAKAQTPEGSLENEKESED